MVPHSVAAAIPSNSGKCLVCRAPPGAPQGTLTASLRAASASLRGAPSGQLPPPRPAGGEGEGRGEGRGGEGKGGRGIMLVGAWCLGYLEV